MKKKIAESIKAKLIELAINGQLDQTDLTQLDVSIFDEHLNQLMS